MYLYKKLKEIRSDIEIQDVYTVSGVDENGKTTTLISYYVPEETGEEKSFRLDFGKKAEYEIYLLDDEHDGTLVKTTENLTLTMKENTCVMIREI